MATTIIISLLIGLTTGIFGGILGIAVEKYNYHTVFQEFSEMNLTCASEYQIRDLCAIINDFVSRGDESANAGRIPLNAPKIASCSKMFRCKARKNPNRDAYI
jgi:hypothetical protein